ncbi:MAG TPA: sarcosine oxidase subunit gamma family protein [Afifellaceae bacterium]|nr:sarcosine oxidase subunit gamma family protein [Afifellaceae bacterium]
MGPNPEPMRERRVSPLAPMRNEMDLASGGAVSLQEVGFRTLVNLRGSPGEDLAATVEQAFGVRLPAVPNTWSGEADRAAVWLGPDEWLLLAPDGEVPALEASLRAARPGDPLLSVSDVSHAYAGLVLAGPAARDVLAKGCPLDLHPRRFPPGACAQTLLAQANILLRLIDQRPAFEIWVRNSFARYLCAWLLDAMAEFTGG